KQSARTQKRKGIALIWVMLMFMVLLGFAGLLIDTAWAYIAAHRLHNAADAAALAGARFVPIIAEPNYTGSPPETIAQTYALKHTAVNAPVDLTTTRIGYPDDEISSLLSGITHPYDVGGDIVIGRYIDPRYDDGLLVSGGFFIVDHDTPDSMLVIARKDGNSNPELPLFFGPIFNIDTINMKRYAIAKVINPYGAGLLALGECDCPGIIFSGSGSVDDLTIFGGGSLYVNSPSGLSISADGNISVVIERLYTAGDIEDKFYNQKNDIEDTDIHTYSNPEPDPYASLPNHDLDAIRAMDDNGTITDASDTQTFGPGYYSGGIQLNNASINLSPGDYYLDSIGQAASLGMTGGLITGEGVTLHIIGDADFGLNVNGGNLGITAPDSGTYAGVAIYQKRDPDYDCTQSCTTPWSLAFPMSEFNGNGIMNIGGAVYMPHNRLELNGSGVINLERVIADRFYISGNGQKIVNYKGIPEIAPASYLVE
ncbi:MAG: pilus assembly protein TadG-related protein, partial [Planctomycetota bacterium]